MTDPSEAQAEKLLPCVELGCRETHGNGCPASYRPAVAQALAEMREAKYRRVTALLNNLVEMESQLAEAREEADRWKHVANHRRLALPLDISNASVRAWPGGLVATLRRP